jgi:hypothetical protein
MKRWLLLIALLLSACGAGAPEATDSPPPDFEAETQAIYAAMLQHPSVAYPPDGLFVLRELTQFDATQFDSALEYGPSLPADLVESFRSRNAGSYTLDAGMDIAQDYALLSEADYAEFPGADGGNWAEFYNRFPGADKVIFFSRAGFDAGGLQALVLMGYRCEGLCGGGGIYLLMKEGGTWQIRQALMEWMA